MGHGKNHSSGGVHLCSKCGWPFPKSHPSAKQRRAHKNICGTIEGFKLVTNGFDDAPNSDEDHKSPSTKVPKVMEDGILDGGIGAMSNRSEGDVFSDAAIEFQDNVDKPDEITDMDLTATLSSKHSEYSDIVQPPHNSSDRSQMPIMSTGTLEHQDFEDRNGSASDLVLIETETLKGDSEESKNVVAVASAAECSVEQPTDTNGNEEDNLNENISDGLILPSEHASGEISETVSIPERRLDVTSDVSVTSGKMEDIISVTELEEKIVESSVIDRDCVSQDKSDTALKNQQDEDIEIDGSYMHVAEDGYELGGNNEAIVKEVLFKGKAGVLQGHKWSDALCPIDADTTENEKDQKVFSLQEQQPVYVADDLDFTGFSVTMINGLPDVQPMVADADIEAGKLNSVSNLNELTNFDDVRKMKTEKHDISVVEIGDGLEDSIKANSTSETLGTDDQSPDVIKEVNVTEGTQLDIVSNGEDDLKEPDSRGNKVQGEGASEDCAVDNTGGENDSRNKDSGPAASKTSTAILQGVSDNGSVKPQLETTVGDVSIGSSSHTDSLEALWGYITVLSTQSDAFSEVEKANKSKVASKQHYDKLNEFDPPSFTTLIEPGCGTDNEKAAVSEIHAAVQTAQSPRTMPLQASWFPSLTHVGNESPGRKKNEEVIKKVTNWHSKQYTPLKNLLSEDKIEPKSARSTRSPPPVVIRTYEKVAEDNEDMGDTVSLIPGSKTPVAEPTIKEPVNEWDSPARFPAEIKQQKRKVKGRPLWLQYICCSSIK